MGNFAYAPARAADLGGGCCADLEERVAELEATTARKGNRVVSLQVYGQVNKALLIWDDGHDSDAYVVDNDNSGSRIGFQGSAKMKPGWTAGYNIELDIQDSASDKVYGRYANTGNSNNTATNADEGTFNTAGNIGAENEIVIRYNYAWIESERLGRISLGQYSTAADGVTEIVLGNSLRNSGLDHGSDFLIRFPGTSTTSLIRLDQFASDFDSARDDVVRYDSPTIYGFILSASWGDNDYHDIALRFKSEWNSIRIAAGIGYQWDASGDGTIFNDTSAFGDAEALTGSISIMHVPTGIYGAFAAGRLDTEVSGPVDSASFWYAQLGLERKWLPYGTTTIYGEYGHYKDQAALFSNTNSSSLDQLGVLSESEATRWGLGIVQKFDSAALELYAQATFWSFDATTDEGVGINFEDLTTIMIGSRIKF
jgi:predicted porin